MPKKKPPGLIPSTRAIESARVRRMKGEVTYLAQIAGKSGDPTTARELKLQLRDARDQPRDVDELLEPMSNHVVQPLGAAAAESA